MGMTHATPMVVTSVLVVGPHFPYRATRTPSARPLQLTSFQFAKPRALSPARPPGQYARPRESRSAGRGHRAAAEQRIGTLRT